MWVESENRSKGAWRGMSFEDMAFLFIFTVGFVGALIVFGVGLGLGWLIFG